MPTGGPRRRQAISFFFSHFHCASTFHIPQSICGAAAPSLRRGARTRLTVPIPFAPIHWSTATPKPTAHAPLPSDHQPATATTTLLLLLPGTDDPPRRRSPCLRPPPHPLPSDSTQQKHHYAYGHRSRRPIASPSLSSHSTDSRRPPAALRQPATSEPAQQPRLQYGEKGVNMAQHEACTKLLTCAEVCGSQPRPSDAGRVEGMEQRKSGPRKRKKETLAAVAASGRPSQQKRDVRRRSRTLFTRRPCASVLFPHCPCLKWRWSYKLYVPRLAGGKQTQP